VDKHNAGKETPIRCREKDPAWKKRLPKLVKKLRAEGRPPLQLCLVKEKEGGKASFKP